MRTGDSVCVRRTPRVSSGSSRRHSKPAVRAPAGASANPACIRSRAPLQHKPEVPPMEYRNEEFKLSLRTSRKYRRRLGGTRGVRPGSHDASTERTPGLGPSPWSEPWRRFTQAQDHLRCPSLGGAPLTLRASHCLYKSKPHRSCGGLQSGGTLVAPPPARVENNGSH